MKNRTILRYSPFKPIRKNLQLALFFLVVLFAESVIAQDPPPDYTELDKGLVIDLNGNVGYIMNPDGTINSLNLANGDSRWSTPQKGKPLAFVNNQLLVQLEDSIPSNDFKIGYLNSASGNVSRTENKALANNIKAAVRSTLNYSFETRVKIVNNKVNLSWDFEPNNFRGIDPEVSRQSTKKGVFLINKTTLNMGNLGMNNFSLEGPMISEEVNTNTIESAAGRQFSSIQDDYVVAIERVSNDAQWQKYKWTVYKRDGTRLGSIRSNLSFRPFYVVGNTLVFTTVPVIRTVEGEVVEEPKSIVGYDLSTGNKSWIKEILDLEYRGPYPP